MGAAVSSRRVRGPRRRRRLRASVPAGARSSVCLYLQAVSGVNVPPLPAQSGQPRTWGMALAQEAGLGEEVRRLCAEAGARVRLPRAHSGRSDKPLTQSLDVKDGGAALPSGWPRGPAGARASGPRLQPWVP